MKRQILIYFLLMAATLQAQEPWVDVAFETRNGEIVPVDRGPNAFSFVGNGSPTGDDDALYGDGSGPVLELQEPALFGFLRAPQSLIEFDLCVDRAPSVANPVQLLVIGNRASPGNTFGLALAGVNQLQVIRYAKGEWRADLIPLKNEVPTLEWCRLAVSLQQREAPSPLRLTVFLDGEEVAQLESDVPLGQPERDGWMLVGGSETPYRSLTGQLRSFAITLDKEAPEAQRVQNAEPTPKVATKEIPIEVRPTAREDAEGWSEALYPYRVEVILDRRVSGRAEIGVELERLYEALRQVCPDPVAWDSFAFERCRFVGPDGTPLPGGFRLVTDGRNLIRNGGIRPNAKGNLPGWSGSLERVSFASDVEVMGKRQNVLKVASGPLETRYLSQPIALKKGQYYLLSALQRTDPVEHAQVQVQLVNPIKKYFLEPQRSYRRFFQLTPEWQRFETLHRPFFERGELRIFTGGNGEVADLSLTPCHWVLQLDFPKETDRFFLYYVPRAGHRLPIPEPSLIAEGKAPQQMDASKLLPEMNPRLRSALRRDEGGVSLWQVPLDWPLRSGFLDAVAPAAATDQPLRITLPRGGRETVVLAVKTGTPEAQLAGTVNGLEASLHRLCAIPVYDGPEPGGKWEAELKGEMKEPLPPPARNWLQDRYDAMAPLDFALTPPSRDGVHPVSVTFQIPRDAKVGLHRGTLTLTATPPGVAPATFTLPVELTVKKAVVKPMHHFLTSFGGQLISFKWQRGNTFSQAADQISVANFHGVKDMKAEEMALNILLTASPEDAATQPAQLASRYFNRMLDSYISPQHVTLFHAVNYDITPQGEGRAPLLGNWDFTLYNRAVQQYMIKRDSTWLGIGHTNGHQMHRFTLRDGSIYSYKPSPAPNAAWRQVSEEEFHRLVGDYYEAIAMNLEQQGVLDRAFLVIDESAASTYDEMGSFVRALRSRPHARRIRTAHTTYTPGLFRIRDEGGNLKMEEIIDIPIPNQDEHFNFFERELHTIWKKPKTIMGYHVETDHMDLLNAGVSTALIPLKFEHLGLAGWYCWASFVWSLPYPYRGPEFDGEKYISGPVINPWINPYYHHGPGVLSWFYPPDPRGPTEEFTDTIIPSYRLDLLGDGILLRALLEMGEAGRDDAGAPLKVDPERLREARKLMATLWPDNPVQWYPNPLVYRQLRTNLLEMLP